VGSPGMEGGPARHRPPEDPATAKRQARGDSTFTDRLPVQLSLFGEPDYPSDGMYPARAWAAAEWHLKFTVNTAPRGRPHWWIADQRRRSA
jgi:hypothetical protein